MALAFEACSFFPSAAAATEADLGRGCAALAPAEHVDHISASAIDFEDRPGVRGTAALSGGTNPVNGAITYSPLTQPGSYVGTCALPPRAHDVCTASLDYFVARYGQG